MATAPIYVDPTPGHNGRVAEAQDEFSNRIHRLESEVTELRDTIARFADIMIGEVKDLKKFQQDLPLVPPSLQGELPSAADETPVPESAQGTPSPPVEPSTRRPWLLMELLRTLGSTFRMYLDPRYRMRRATQLMVPLILGLLALNYFFFHFVFTLPLVSTIIEKIVDMTLAVLLYQVIQREVIRYRSVISQLTAWQQYRARTMVINAEPHETTLETE